MSFAEQYCLWFFLLAFACAMVMQIANAAADTRSAFVRHIKQPFNRLLISYVEQFNRARFYRVPRSGLNDNPFKPSTKGKQ